MDVTGQLIFEGIAEDELAPLLAQLERRRFAAGTDLLQEGDNPSELYVIQSGAAEVLVTDRYGQRHVVDYSSPGSVLGEMSLLTGQPVSATVRAITDVETLVLTASDFDRIGNTFPQIFRNLAVLLANRLRHSHLRHLNISNRSTILLLNSGAPNPALLAYALTCSMSWHLRKPVLLVVLSDERPAELSGLVAAAVRTNEHPQGPGAKVVVVSPEGDYSVESLASTVNRLHDTFDHIALLASGDQFRQGVPGLDLRTLRMVGLHSAISNRATDSNERLVALRAWVPGSKATRPDANGVLNVPPLDRADEDALREGMLPISTLAGRAVGRAARELCGLKVGLALGAGSEKGYAHIGVLQVLERLGVPLDYLAGTSVGSGVAAVLATGHNLEETEQILTQVGSAAFKFRLRGGSLLSSTGLRDQLRAVMDERRFEDLDVPLAVVAADVATGREVVFRSGPLWPALLASMSIPGVYPAQRMGPYVLVDGGILNPVPSDTVAGLGADRVIAVKLGSDSAEGPAEVEASVPVDGGASMVQVLTRSMAIMQSRITTQTAMAATVLIEPAFEDPGDWRRLRNFSLGRRYIEAGVAAAEEAIPRLAAALPWLQASTNR